MANPDFPYLDNCRADIRLLGIPNILNSFCQFTSAPRCGMTTHHLSQVMIIDGAEPKHIFTGIETEIANYTFNNSEREYDCEIVAVIPKYTPSFLHGGIDNCPQIYVVVLNLLPNGDRELDYFTIDRYSMGSNGFGWIPKIDNLGRIRPGEILDRDTTITCSPGVQNGESCLGVNLNIAYGSFPETIEDAFIISKSAAKKLQTTQVSKVIIECRMDRRPLNLYGTSGDRFTEKFLPDIGTHVRDDGALCAFRPTHWTTSVADFDPEALRKPLPHQDEILYIEPGAKIVDLTFNINNNKINDCYDQAILYARNSTQCWESIYLAYVKYKGKHKLSAKMSTLVTNAMYRMLANGMNVPSITNDSGKPIRNFDIEGENGRIVDFMQVVVHYTVPRPVSKGDKLTDFHGSN